jgi:hypothetical protein
MPAGVDVTLPLPLPVFVTVSVYVRGANLAVTDLAAVIGTAHVAAVPVQAPDQPVKVELLAGVAVSVTKTPAA